MSFVKTGSVTVIIHVTVQLDFCTSFHSLWEIWMKYDTDNLHVTPVQDCEFPVNRLIDRNTLLKAVHKFLPVFYLDSNRFEISSMPEMTAKRHCVGVSLVNTGAVKAAFYLRA
jgi:hypothetical protein